MADQNTLRDMLDASFTASDSGTLAPVADAVPIVAAAPEVKESSEDAAQRLRDEQGRFAAKEVDAKAALEVPAVPTDQAPIAPVIEAAPTPQRPTTWKKEYLPIWDKIATGQVLTPEESKKLAEYSHQREREYATGVSIYRNEAQQAHEIRAAVEPFLPVLQQHNMKVSDWIKNLGTAHQTLALGTPEQKLQMFANMAQQYGIPLQAVTQIAQGAQVDPMTGQNMQQWQQANNEIAVLKAWKDQQEHQRMQQQLAEFEDTSKYPHFDLVRGDMAQLLESGIARDLKSAYAKAVRMNDEAWTAEQERQVQAAPIVVPAASKQDAVVKAKAAAVSPKSVTPNGVVKPVNAQGLREQLESGFESIASGRL